MFVFRSLISNVSKQTRTCTITGFASFHTATPFYAARKGTRARKEGKKVKVEIKKVAWTPENKKKKGVQVTRKVDESHLGYPEDDIYLQKEYKLRQFQFSEAISGMRETHHPTMYNLPNAFVTASVEINTATHIKKTKYLEPYTHIVEVNHPFDHGEDRSILAFCKEHDLAAQLQDMGVALVGGPDTIKGIERGTVTMPDFQYVVCNPKILADLMLIRGLLKRRLPTIKNQTLGVDLIGITKRLQTGIRYSMKRDPVESDFGFADFTIGRLSMGTEQLEDNLKSVLRDISSMRPTSKPLEEDFITRILLWSDPSPEKFKIEMDNLIEKPQPKEETDSDDENEEGELNVAKA